MVGEPALRLAVRLQRAEEAGGIHLFEIGTDHVARCGDGLRALFGLPAGATFDYAAWLTRLHPEDRDWVNADFSRLLTAGGTTEVEYRILLPDGTVRWLFSRAQKASADPAASIFGVTIDITDRRAATERLAESQQATEVSEARLRAALESTTDSVFLLSGDWRFTFLNRRAIAQISGGRDLLGRIIWDAFPEAIGGTLWEAYRRCMAERVPTEAEEFYFPLGRMFSARTFPAEDGGIAVFFRDVTEERRASARLAEAEGLLRALGEASPDLLFAKDRAGRMLYANPAALRVIGRPAADVLGRNEAEWHADAEQAALLMANDQRIMARGITETVEEPFHDAGRREIRIFQGTKAPLRDPATGEVIGLVGVARDVTEERRIRHALAESGARLRLATEGAGVGTWEMDLVAGRGSWSREAVALLGMDRAEFDAEDWVEGFHPEDRPFATEAWRRAIEEGAPYQLEFRTARPAPDGGERWLLTRGRIETSPSTDRPVRGAGILLDITARKRAETALAESEARFRAAVRAVSGIVWTNDAEGRMTGEQPGWQALTGQTRADYEGLGWSRAIHPQDVQATLHAWNQAVAGRTTFVFEHRLRRRDGEWRRFSIRAIPVLREDGRVREWVGVHTDVTDQREAEAVLARDKAELERLVEERTRDLQETQARLAHARRMEALGQLAGGIAHDFNNVLQATRSGAALIERRSGDSELVRHLARLIVEAADRGTSVTRRLLAFSRRGELRAEPLRPASLLSSMAEVLAHTLGATIEVRAEADPGLPPLMADKGQLETVLVNLATNSSDAMGGSGVLTLGVAMETRTEDAGPGDPVPLKAGDYIRLWVADSGRGMDAETLARACEPFFTTKGPGKGTGLGLAMARGFAEQSGGALRIESAPGRGTAVTMWLPVADPSLPLRETPGDEVGQVAALSHRVLLVDDEDLVREMLAREIREGGYEVVSVGDGPAALALLDSGERFDLLVSDLSMPRMDGLTLIQEAQRRRPSLPSILLTGYAGQVAEQAAGGSLSVVRKPIEGAELVERLHALSGAAFALPGSH